jgi:hypothetical protein
VNEDLQESRSGLILWHYLGIVGRTMAQVVSRRPLTAEARVRARVNPCWICGGQSGTGTGFSPSSSVFSCQYIIPPSLSKFISSGECVIGYMLTYAGIHAWVLDPPPSGKKKSRHSSGRSEETYEDTSVRIAGLRAEIRNRDLSNTKQKCYPHDHDVPSGQPCCYIMKRIHTWRPPLWSSG